MRIGVYNDIMKTKNLTAKEVLKILHKNGWIIIGQRGSHVQLKHNENPGKITVPSHGNKTIHPKVIKSIFKQAGIDPAKI